MTRREKKRLGNGTTFTTRDFNDWKNKSFDPNIRQIKKNQKNLFCLKKQMGEIRGFIIGPSENSLEVLVDKDAKHVSPLVNIIRSTIRTDALKISGVVITAMSFIFALLVWGVENKIFIKLFKTIIEP